MATYAMFPRMFTATYEPPGLGTSPNVIPSLFRLSAIVVFSMRGIFYFSKNTPKLIRSMKRKLIFYEAEGGMHEVCRVLRVILKSQTVKHSDGYSVRRNIFPFSRPILEPDRVSSPSMKDFGNAR